MPTLEAEMLRDRRTKNLPSADVATGNTVRISMNSLPIPVVLMLRCSALSHHAVRAAARHAGLNLAVEFAENRREFLEEIRRGSADLVIAGPDQQRRNRG